MLNLFIFNLILISYKIIAISYVNETFEEYLNAEQILLDYLKADYSPLVSAISTRGRYSNQSITVDVTWQLNSARVLHLDESQQTIKMICDGYYIWTDPRLTWNPADFSDIESVSVDVSTIWIPDIVPDRLYDITDTILIGIPRAMVNYNGSVIFSLNALISVLCEIEISGFPFDNQECYIRMKSIKYYAEELRVSTVYEPSNDDFKYMSSGEWSLQSITLDQMTEMEAKYGKNFSVAAYKMRFRRNPTFYITLIIIPCQTIIYVTIIVLFSSPIQTDTYFHKVHIGFQATLGSILILQITTKNMPKTQYTPILSIYIMVNILIIASSVLILLAVVRHLGSGPNGSLRQFCARRLDNCCTKILMEKIHFFLLWSYIMATTANLLIILL